MQVNLYANDQKVKLLTSFKQSSTPPIPIPRVNEIITFSKQDSKWHEVKGYKINVFRYRVINLTHDYSKHEIRITGNLISSEVRFYKPKEKVKNSD